MPDCKKETPSLRHARRGRRVVTLVLALTITAILGTVLVGCPSTEGLELRKLTHDGTKRTYYLHVPDDLSPSTPAPLVLALHRFTETGARMAEMTGFNEVADDEHFMVAYPNGKRRRFSYEPGSKPDDAAFVLAVIEDIAANHALDRSRIYVAGASNGGFLTYLLACEHPESFAAVAPVMATFLKEVAATCTPVHDMPIMIIHGDADPIVPYDADTIFAGPGMTLEAVSVPDTVAFWVEQNGCTPEPVTEELPDQSPQDGTTTFIDSYLDEKALAKVVHIRVRNGGHTWPGGNERVPTFIVGKQNQDFDASRFIWDFFALHQRPPESAQGH